MFEKKNVPIVYFNVFLLKLNLKFAEVYKDGIQLYSHRN